MLQKKINYPNGSYGKADIYQEENQHIWEVKSCGPSALFGPTQLLGYISGTVEQTRIHPKIGTAIFERTFQIGQFTVKYWTVAGVVLYDFWLTNPKRQHEFVAPKETVREAIEIVGDVAMFGGATIVTAWALSHIAGKNFDFVYWVYNLR